MLLHDGWIELTTLCRDSCCLWVGTHSAHAQAMLRREKNDLEQMTAIDLFCGLGGWAEGLLAENYRVIGFDIERHDYGRGSYPGQLVLQDVRTLHGSQFKGATVIVASPPCTEYSYMAMPWSRAKQIARALEGNGEFPEGYAGSRTVAELNELFDTCFRIQREASEAAGRHIPMVVENVRGAQRWVGRAKANYGSFYLWGDVGMVGRRVVSAIPRYGEGVQAFRGGKNDHGSWFGVAHNTESGHGRNPVNYPQKFNPDGSNHPRGSWFAIADSVNRGARAEKVPGFRFDGSGKSFQTAAVKMATAADGKQYGGDFGWDGSAMRTGSSKSDSRRAASAGIAKIPFPLALHIARVFKNQYAGVQR